MTFLLEVVKAFMIKESVYNLHSSCFVTIGLLLHNTVYEHCTPVSVNEHSLVYKVHHVLQVTNVLP